VQIDTKTIAASTDGYKTRISLHAGTLAIIANHFCTLRTVMAKSLSLNASHWLQKLFALLFRMTQHEVHRDWHGVWRSRKRPAVACADVALGWADHPGVALPFRFRGPRPKLMVSTNGKIVTRPIVDIGPWTNDPYWMTGARPPAEVREERICQGGGRTAPASISRRRRGRQSASPERAK
jgi:hypothetical protein